ncbi:MAG: hypothetical protein RLZZ282_1565, partial [Verrucomicrobiota bacterium]
MAGQSNGCHDGLGARCVGWIAQMSGAVEWNLLGRPQDSPVPQRVGAAC